MDAAQISQCCADTRLEKKERIIENLNADDVELTNEEFKALDSELDKHKVYGHRGLGGF